MCVCVGSAVRSAVVLVHHCRTAGARILAVLGVESDQGLAIAVGRPKGAVVRQCVDVVVAVPHTSNEPGDELAHRTTNTHTHTHTYRKNRDPTPHTHGRADIEQLRVRCWVARQPESNHVVHTIIAERKNDGCGAEYVCVVLCLYIYIWMFLVTRLQTCT